MPIQTEESKRYDETVYQAVKAEGENGITFTNLCAKMPAEHSATNNALQRLVRQKRVNKAARGLYVAV